MPKARAPATRSAMTNGRRLHLVRPSGWTAEGRRFQDLVEALTEERGGAAALDVARQEAIRMYALLSVERSRIEVDMASGRPVDAEHYGRLCDRADRQYRRMGPPLPRAKQSLRDQLLQRAGKL